ncbi:gp436 family protein [Marinobacterium litorale]|uniref:gp436 family protein n=1 Tax=Marinobacterium litorale TaxID=404770 RepID=UPI0004180B6B|nr:DUF1320 domain-containing protein [Marinobacterium litorale]
MSYVTHEQLADIPGARELSQVATAEHEQLVDYDLMQATLTGADRSAWTADEIAVADDALGRIDDAVANADAMIDGYLVLRDYLPLIDTFGAVPGIVTVWSRAIARYLLHKDRISADATDPIVRDYRDAMKLLQQVAEGKFSLGAGDTKTNSRAGLADWDAPDRQFTRDTLRDF